jgi:hypothetical protein
MEDNEIKDFSRTAFFLVTGFSFFFFSKTLQWLDKTREPVFAWIGIVAIIIGLLNGIVTLKEKPGKN